MNRQRPVVVLVFAILNIVFGSIGVLASLCAVCGGAFLYFAFTSATGPGSNEARDVFVLMDQAMPSMKYVLGIQMAVGLIMAIVLISAGIGLLKMRDWARWASILYGVVGVVSGIFGLGYQMAVLNPGMEQWQREFQQKMADQYRAKGMIPPPQPPPSNPMGGAVSSVAGAIIGMAYSIALLIVMFLPQVSSAFTDRPAASGPGDQRFYRSPGPPMR